MSHVTHVNAAIHSQIDVRSITWLHTILLSATWINLDRLTNWKRFFFSVSLKKTRINFVKLRGIQRQLKFTHTLDQVEKRRRKTIRKKLCPRNKVSWLSHLTLTNTFIIAHKTKQKRKRKKNIKSSFSFKFLPFHPPAFSFVKKSK